MENVIESPARMILLLLFLVIMLLLVSAFFPQSLEAKGEIEKSKAKEASEKIPRIIQLVNEPVASVSCNKLGGKYRYSVIVPVTAKFEGTGKEEMTVVSSVEFKGEKIKGNEFTMKAKEPAVADIKAEVSSGEPPMIVKNSEQSYSGAILSGQMLLLKGFSIKNIGQLALGLQRAGTCKAYLIIQCKSGVMPITMYLDGDKSCAEQEDNYNCRKSLKMCGADVDIEMTKMSSGGILSHCNSRTAEFSVSVGEVKEEFIEAELGEDVTVAFWRKPAISEPQNCWEQGLAYIPKACTELILGAYAITIKPENYKSC